MNKISLKIVVSLAIIFLGINAFSQTFSYRKFPSANYETVAINKTSFVEATDYLPSNYSKKGDVDYTVYLQKAISENPKVILPDFSIMINYNGLQLRSNSSLYFRNNSKLLMKPNDQSHYSMLKISRVNNVKVYNPVLIGDRNKHRDNGGEWGMGINILSSSNISIFNPVISNCWGDGIYLGVNSSNILYNENIEISGGVLDNNRRNGISIISVRKLLIKNLTISNTHGTNPQVGIDFEPNGSTDILKEVFLENVYTFNNAKEGLFFNFSRFLIAGGNADVIVKSFKNDYSKYDIGYSTFLSKKMQADLTAKKAKVALNKNIDGVIDFTTPSTIKQYKIKVYSTQPNDNIILRLNGINLDKNSYK